MTKKPPSRLHRLGAALRGSGAPPPRRLRRELRHDDELRPRRAVVGLSLVAAGAMTVVGLYQMGLLRKLPLGSGRKVEGKPDAYRKLSMPYGMRALRDHVTTALLAAAGGADRARDKPWLPVLTVAKLGWDVYSSAQRTRRQWAEHGEVSPWTILATAAAAVALPLALPEAGRGGEKLVHDVGRALA